MIYGDTWQTKIRRLRRESKLLKISYQKSAKNELVLPKSEDEIAEWTKKYPDVAGIVETIADKKARERSSDLDKRLENIEKDEG